MVRRVTARVDVDADGAKQGAAETERSAGRIAGAFDGLKAKAGNAREALAGFGDKVGGIAREKLGPLGDAADKAGIDLDKISPAALAGGAALVGLGAAIAGGIAKMDELVSSTRTYKDAAGLSWEEASKLGGAFHDMGIEAEDGADVLKTMGEIIGTDAAKFDTYGVAIAKANDGSVDMTETLKNVAERFQNMKDPAERAALGSELFGDTWLKIAPVLERGADGVQDLIDSVDESRIVTSESAKAQEDYKRSMRELSDAVGELQMELAQKLVPELAEGAGALARFVKWANDTEDALVGFGAVNRDVHHDAALTGSAIGDAALKMADLALAAGPAAQKTEDLAAAERAAEAAARDQARETADTAQAIKDLEQALDDATAAQERAKASVVTAFESQNRYEQAQRDTAAAMTETTAAADALTTATNEHGAESEQAVKAQADYSRALEDAQQKVYSQAQAAVDLAQKQAEVSGATLTTAEANQVYRDKLVEARDATNDPVLKQALDTKITQYDEFSIKANSSATGVAEANKKLADAKTAVADPALGEALDTAASKFGGLATAAWQAADGMAAAAIRAAANFTPSMPAPVSQESGDPASIAQRFEGQRAGGFAVQRAGVDTGGTAAPTIVIATPIGRPNDVIRWVREELRKLERSER